VTVSCLLAGPHSTALTGEFMADRQTRASKATNIDRYEFNNGIPPSVSWMFCQPNALKRLPHSLGARPTPPAELSHRPSFTRAAGNRPSKLSQRTCRNELLQLEESRKGLLLRLAHRRSTTALYPLRPHPYRKLERFYQIGSPRGMWKPEEFPSQWSLQSWLFLALSRGRCQSPEIVPSFSGGPSTRAASRVLATTGGQ
jgi:hypothetical protein